jgi:DNA-binding response OmpR family regulator
MRTLVVDDEAQIAHFLRRGLEQEGFCVTVAFDGASALVAARASAFDVILLDWMLPDRDGLSLCRTLREEGNRTPIVMLTARDAVRDKVSGLDGGADDYLTKPFEFDELLARMRSVLRRADAGGPAQLVVADLILDPATRRVTRAGREVDLTPREFALLEFLMRGPGRVHDRRELLRHVWGYDHDPQTNIVDVYVGYLRRKIDAGATRPLLQTIAGVGYRLDPGANG